MSSTSFCISQQREKVIQKYVAENSSKLISWLIKTSTGQTITDPTSGMRMYDRGLIETYARSFDFSPAPDISRPSRIKRIVAAF